MATVYLAREVRHDRQVALKVLRPELAAILGRERFLTEIRLTAQLDHPNILTLIDSGEADGLLYYVLPFVRGESLRARLDREKQLGLEETVRIATQVAAALEYAHQRGIIHRDIKPENILLHEGVAMVADFGIALALREAGGERLTETGLSLGTPQYMSPEQATGSRLLDARSDIYSLGAVVYEMLAGEPPFSGPSAQAVIAKLMTQRPMGIRILRDSVSPALEAVVLKALEKVPADRFSTATAFAAALAAPGFPVPTRGRRILWAAVIALATVVAAWKWGGLGKFAADHFTAASSGENLLGNQRIAVLYFRTTGGDPDLPLVADGVTEGLIDTLARVDGLRVRPSNSVAQFRGRAAPADSVARALDVESLVEGALEKVGDRYRVSVQVVEASTGAASEARSFEGSLEEMIPIEGELARAVVTMLKAKPHHRTNAWLMEQRARQARGVGDSLIANDDTAGFIAQFARADSLAGLAERLDPSWIEPVLFRGNLAYRRSRLTDDASHARPAIEAALSFADRALSMNRDDPNALELRGTAHYWSWLLQSEPDSIKAVALLKSAQHDLEEATRLNPRQAGAWATLSHLYFQTGTGLDVMRAAEKAYEADPYIGTANMVLRRLFFASYDVGEYSNSLKWCEEGVRRLPKDPNIIDCQIWLMTMPAGKPDVPLAWRLADSGLALTPGPEKAFRRLYRQLLVGAVLARAGQADSARRLTARSLGSAEVDPSRDLSDLAAFVYTLLGDKEQAIQQLGVNLAANPERRASVAADPGWWFRPLVNDPRFKALLAAPR